MLRTGQAITKIFIDFKMMQLFFFVIVISKNHASFLCMLANNRDTMRQNILFFFTISFYVIIIQKLKLEFYAFYHFLRRNINIEKNIQLDFIYIYYDISLP